MASGMVTEDRHQGFVAYFGELPPITERDKAALLDALQQHARAERAKAKAARGGAATPPPT